MANINLAGSTLDGVSLDRRLPIERVMSKIAIQDGLTLNGTLVLGDGSYFNFRGL